MARRLLSLSGIVPLGAFLLLHLALNESAVWGSLAFANTVGVISRVPALVLFEVLFVFAPLLVHAGAGLWLMLAPATSAPTPSPYPLRVGWAMRATGVVALVFLALHLPEFRFRARGARLDGGELATLLAADLASTSHGVPWRGILYLVAMGCVVFHFAAGLWGAFAASSRGRDRPRAQRTAAWAALAFGGLLWMAFAEIVVFHATGARFFDRSESSSASACP